MRLDVNMNEDFNVQKQAQTLYPTPVVCFVPSHSSPTPPIIHVFAGIFQTMVLP